MKLYSGPLSLFSRKIEIALAEKGLVHDRVMVPFTQEAGYSPKHPDVLAVNPKGQVPVLLDGDVSLFDSTLIFEYLEDAYPEPPLYPVGANARARCRTFELAADEILLPQVAALMYRTEPVNPDIETQRRVEADGERAEREIDAYYAGLDLALEVDGYLCGEFSVADIAMFMTILFANRLGAPNLADHPTLFAWFERVGSRPSAAAAAREIATADRELSPTP